MIFRYWRIDFRRCFCTGQFAVSVMGVTLIHFLVLVQRGEFPPSVFYSLIMVWGSNGMVLVFMFTAFAYAACFSEDFETGYVLQAVLRGNLCGYVLSKCICIFLSSVITMMAGRLLFALILRCICPWEVSMGELQILLDAGCFTAVLKKQQYVLYILYHGLWQGLWAGVLSLGAALTSLYTNNRLMVFAFPIMAHHLIRRIGYYFLWKENYILDPDRVFQIRYNVWNNEVYSLAYAWILGGTLFSLLFGLICIKAAGRMKNG